MTRPAVLVLHHRSSPTSSRYDQWLADYDGDVVLLCSREGLDLIGEDLPTTHEYAHLEAVTGYETAGRVEARVLELSKAYDIEHLVTCQEFDLERAAQLREILGLPGQRIDSVVPFRDKVAMKDIVRAAGIPTAEYRAVHCATDIVAFAREHGFPLVLKPRNGAGSVGVRIVRSERDLTELLDSDLGLYGELWPNLVVEKFVPGSMCHVDGLVVDGTLVFAWPSRYLFVEMDFATDRAGRLDVTLDAGDPRSERLREFTGEVLAALPCPETFVFHAEVFVTPDDDLVLCEVASRTGGAAIRDVLRGLFEADVNEWWLRGHVGLPLPVDRAPLTPVRMAGGVTLTKRTGVVAALPGEPPFPWVSKATVGVRRGQVVRSATYTSDALAVFVVTGPDRMTVERRLRQVETWFLAGLVLDPAEPAASTALPAAS